MVSQSCSLFCFLSMLLPGSNECAVSKLAVSFLLLSEAIASQRQTSHTKAVVVEINSFCGPQRCRQAIVTLSFRHSRGNAFLHRSTLPSPMSTVERIGPNATANLTTPVAKAKYDAIQSLPERGFKKNDLKEELMDTLEEDPQCTERQWNAEVKTTVTKPNRSVGTWILRERIAVLLDGGCAEKHRKPTILAITKVARSRRRLGRRGPMQR